MTRTESLNSVCKTSSLSLLLSSALFCAVCVWQRSVTMLPVCWLVSPMKFCRQSRQMLVPDCFRCQVLRARSLRVHLMNWVRQRQVTGILHRPDTHSWMHKKAILLQLEGHLEDMALTCSDQGVKYSIEASSSINTCVETTHSHLAH